MLTPYAVLLARRLDDDETIRALYHAIARKTHPDAVKYYPANTQAQVSLEWHSATTAYTQIKTEALRAAWEKLQASLSGRCKACQGTGVKGSRFGGAKVVVCNGCKGEGRTK